MINLILGTAQLGLEKYGACNTIGIPSTEEALEMIKVALAYGITRFDTSPLYGKSQRRLGNALKNEKPWCKLYTKVNLACNYCDMADQQLTASLIELQRDSVEGVFANSTDCNSSLMEIVMANKWKIDGRIKKFGVSVYNMKEALHKLGCAHIDMVQIPYNIIDQRASKVHLFSIADDLGKDVFVRSVFLQGNLLNYTNNCYKHVPIGQFHRVTKNFSKHPMELCFEFIKNTAPNAHILAGAESLIQIEEIVFHYNNVMKDDYALFSIADPRVVYDGMVDPRRWDKGDMYGNK
jgi:aryl-alcohol dehydrogenase-like predicted oxidoreductase